MCSVETGLTGVGPSSGFLVTHTSSQSNHELGWGQGDPAAETSERYTIQSLVSEAVRLWASNRPFCVSLGRMTLTHQTPQLPNFLPGGRQRAGKDVGALWVVHCNAASDVDALATTVVTTTCGYLNLG